MARGPDGSGAAPGGALADQLFNADTLGDLAREHSELPGFDAERFLERVLPGLAERGLLARLDLIADALEAELPARFEAMAEALEAAMPPPLDPTRRDDDFGRFIHAVPGILAVRHGLESHRERALDLLHQATQRFSMEFYIRPFLDRWPDETLARLDAWCGDENYHVRRLVSEGTRPRLPWAKKIALAPDVPLRFLDRLHADPTRFVTRSVANHLNDLSRLMPERVLAHLGAWRAAGQQAPRELAWITRHALRTAVKRGERGALDFLGYRRGAVTAKLALADAAPWIGGHLEFDVTLVAQVELAVMVDYRIRFARPGGLGEKVFKLATAALVPGEPRVFAKRHYLKGDATTFRLYPGQHSVVLQVNGEDVAEAPFDLRPAAD